VSVLNFSISASQAEIALQVAAEAADADRLARSLPPEFSLALKEVMEWRKCTVDELAEGSLLSTKTIQRLRTGAVSEPLIETTFALLICLQLPNPLLDALVLRTGKGYRLTEEHQIMKGLVMTAYGRYTIHDVNAALRAHGLEELTGKE
jgi:hypothetical protein